MSWFSGLFPGSSMFENTDYRHYSQENHKNTTGMFKERRPGYMPDAERVMLSAIEKWTKYGRFPFKLILHSLILTLIIVQVFTVMNQLTIPVTSGEDILAHFFLGVDRVAQQEVIYTVDGVIDRISKSVGVYYNLNNHTVYHYYTDKDDEGITIPLNMLVNYRLSISKDAPYTVQKSYTLDLENPIGPFANLTYEETKYYLNHSESITLRFTLYDDVTSTQFGAAPLEWNVDVRFVNTGGIFVVTVWADARVGSVSFLRSLAWIPALIVVVCIISFLLGMKSLASSISVLNRVRRNWNSLDLEHLIQAYKIVDPPGVIPIYYWSDIPIAVKLDFVSIWNLMEALGELFLCIGCAIGFAIDHGLPVSDPARLCFGIGFLILSVNFIKYLEYWKKFSALILTLQGSFMRNLRFVVSVFPLFMGFVVCGYIMFSPYSNYFSDIDATVLTLFSLINGDTTHLVFQTIRDHYPYPKIALAYLFFFDILFITLVLNVFLYIIEDAYQAAALWIRGAGSKLSRGHRKLRADNPLPSNWKPTLGSIEFDIPLLFQILETAMLIRDTPEIELTGDIAMMSIQRPRQKAAIERILHTSSEVFPMSAPSAALLDPLSSSSSSASILNSNSQQSSSAAMFQAAMLPRNTSTPTIQREIQTSTTTPKYTPNQLSSLEGLQNAIEETVAITQLQFSQEVEKKIKSMQDEYSQRLQREVAQIMMQSSALRERFEAQRRAHQAQEEQKPDVSGTKD